MSCHDHNLEEGEEDDEKLTLIGYDGKNVIQKHPYDCSELGYMLNDYLIRNDEDHRVYRKFYKCFKTGKKKKSVRQLFFLCRNFVFGTTRCTVQKRVESYNSRIKHRCEYKPESFTVVEKDKDDGLRKYTKDEMTIKANPILDSVCRLFMDCAYAFRSVESKYFRQMLIETLNLRGAIPPYIMKFIFPPVLASAAPFSSSASPPSSSLHSPPSPSSSLLALSSSPATNSSSSSSPSEPSPIIFPPTTIPTDVPNTSTLTSFFSNFPFAHCDGKPSLTSSQTMTMLARIALGYCYTVTAEAECERVFSLLKWAMPKRRNRLGKEALFYTLAAQAGKKRKK